MDYILIIYIVLAFGPMLYFQYRFFNSTLKVSRIENETIKKEALKDLRNKTTPIGIILLINFILTSFIFFLINSLNH